MAFIAEDGAASARDRAADKFYFAAWRWHFYAGLYVAPFLIMLAVTGLIMLWASMLVGRDGERAAVAAIGEALPVSAQVEAALAAVPGSTPLRYAAPMRPDLAAFVEVSTEDGARIVTVDPYAGRAIAQWASASSWYDFASDIHGTLLIGDLGDRLIEIAAGLGVLLMATGLYMTLSREGLRASFVPDLGARGRALWRTLHVTVGSWSAVILLVFLLSGLSWAGIWGERLTQAWSTFPAEKWDAVPLSDATHASMAHSAAKQVPWALEQTPMPASGSAAGAAGAGPEPTVDAVAAFAAGLGLPGRFQIAFPQGETGVWTVSHDSMSNDGPDPTADRTIHLDRFSGKVLADVRFADYSGWGKAMAVGIAFHEGDMGAWNVALNTLFCLAMIFAAASGAVMWWKRRPARLARVGAPPLPADLPHWRGAAVVGLLICLLFPLVGLTVLAVLALDFLVLSRLPALKRAMS